ncbi:MAG TPA: hypothetical protein VMN78_11565 [Longimicrobiales bacterium]|nr:hypothetical protein [Longimicrobiales bacterium]
MRRKRFAATAVLGVVGIMAIGACASAGGRTDDPAAASAAAPSFESPPIRAAYLDDGGVIRWRDTDEEVRLFGVNYALPSSGDYRAAGYLTDDRKALVDQDMAHFARMGWEGLRVAFWGDWQNADLEGNLIENEHLDLVDYIVARARERGIYILFNPIHTYHAGWPDAMGDSFPGFAAHIEKGVLGTDPAAIAAQVNYLRQILDHVNPYTGVRLADEPSILFVEMINEPAHHPEDVEQSVEYIDALVGAVRDAGSDAITFHNVSQDFRIAEAIRRSTVDGASFGWYPTGLNSGHELRGNHLRSVEDYAPMRMPVLDGIPRLVYEFDSADQLTGTMYPAMAREFVRGGVQLAAMFAYDMLLTASRNLGWQTHHLNLVYTPRKAMSAVIAAEAMRRLPRGESYGEYPQQNAFGPFEIFPDEDLTVMNAPDAFMHTGDTDVAPIDASSLTRIAGTGSSPLVQYAGTGIYFLDRVREGVWRLEVYPDVVPVDDPFEMPRVDKIVTRAIYREWPMTVRLPELGESFVVQPIDTDSGAGVGAGAVAAADGRFTVTPGVYVLAADGPIDPASLPALVPGTNVRFGEFVAPAPDPWPLHAELLDMPEEWVAGRPHQVRARVVPAQPSTIGGMDDDSVTLWLAPAGRGWFRPFPMEHTDAYEYRLTIPSMEEGVYDYVLSVTSGDSTTTFPSRVRRAPTDWDYGRQETWRLRVVDPNESAPPAPLALLDADEDLDRLSFSRVGDGWREGIFRIVPSSPSGDAVIHLELPVNVGGISPEDYTMSLYVGDRIASRASMLPRVSGVALRIRGIGPSQVVHVTLVEEDGTSWSAAVELDDRWSGPVIQLTDLRSARGVKLPQGYPSNWNYWLEPATRRGGAGDAIHLSRVERLQLSLRRPDGDEVEPGTYGIEVESVALVFRFSVQLRVPYEP